MATLEKTFSLEYNTKLQTKNLLQKFTIDFNNIDLSKWTLKITEYSNSTKKSLVLIAKDPVIVDGLDTLNKNIYDKDISYLDRNLNPVNFTGYVYKFWMYPMIDIGSLTLYATTGAEFDKAIRNILGEESGTAKALLTPSFGATTLNNINYPYACTNTFGGEVIVPKSVDGKTLYNSEAIVKNIDVKSLGINMPSDEERGKNEETKELFKNLSDPDFNYFGSNGYNWAFHSGGLSSSNTVVSSDNQFPFAYAKAHLFVTSKADTTSSFELPTSVVEFQLFNDFTETSYANISKDRIICINPFFEYAMITDCKVQRATPCLVVGGVKKIEATEEDEGINLTK